NGRIHKYSGSRENPAKALQFVMVLRKWLEGARIKNILATPNERIATLYLAARNELGDPIDLRLIIEIMGKHSNIILVDAQGMILDGIRRYGSQLSRYREVLPGRIYLPPPPINKLPFLPPDEEALASALYSASATVLEQALKQKISGVSPLLAQNIPLLAGLMPQLSVETMGSHEIRLIYQQLQMISDKLRNSTYQPLITIKGKQYLDFYAFPLPSFLGRGTITFPTMNEAVDAFYSQLELRQEFERRRNGLAKSLRQHRQRLQKKIELEEAELAHCEAASAYREAADLLAANIYFLQKGQTSVELPSFEDEQKKIIIHLAPAKTIQENIQNYYRRYGKAKNARRLIEDQLKINREQLAYLFSIEQSMEDSESANELAVIEKEAEAAGFFQRRAVIGRPREATTDQMQLQPRRYLSQDGFIIQIGRNNRQNERLSLKLAADDDIWLHVQKMPGSHVVISSDGREVPERTIIEAATYAAWFSKARGSGKTAVDYTRAANLKKPSGTPPGYVTYTDQKTVYVEPKEPGEESLQAEPQQSP
ncbi:MAG: fibronectin/fibrinogen-binding protein, partial [Clostridia bacterium]|nr:fibronectin/fibrinogen-binding protein [Clostridia bacterium]